MSPSLDTIAWLVPMANNPASKKVLSLPANGDLTNPLPEDIASTIPSILGSTSPEAIHLRFSTATKRPGKFILGTDPETCDIILPSLPNVSRQHAFFSFDSQARLTVTDLSEHGTSVWYDWESKGDKTDHTWTLSGSPQDAGDVFPNSAKRILLDIQGVRFQVIANLKSMRADCASFQEQVDKFSALPDCWTDGLAVGWDRAACRSASAAVAPLFNCEAMFQHIYVDKIGDNLAGEMYLWNMNRPWEALVKVTA